MYAEQPRGLGGLALGRKEIDEGSFPVPVGEKKKNIKRMSFMFHALDTSLLSYFMQWLHSSSLTFVRLERPQNGLHSLAETFITIET